MGRTLERTLAQSTCCVPMEKETRAPYADSGKRSLANPPVIHQARPLGMHLCPFPREAFGGSGLPLGE